MSLIRADKDWVLVTDGIDEAAISKVPRYVRFTSELPRNTLLKVDKPTLLAEALTLLPQQTFGESR